MPCDVRLPEAVQVEEAFGEASGGRRIGAVAAVGQGVAAAQAQPVAEVLVQLRVRRQASLLPAGRGEGGSEKNKDGGRKEEKKKKEGYEAHNVTGVESGTKREGEGQFTEVNN